MERNIEDFSPDITPVVPPKRKKRGSARSKLPRVVISILLVMLLLGGLGGVLYAVTHSTSPCPASVDTTPAPDGEPIAISDGRIAFDMSRHGSNYKALAAGDIQKGDINGAKQNWSNELTDGQDSNDAETLIYREDQQVLASRSPYITLIVVTMLSGDPNSIGVGRADLQGAYVAQKEFNDGHKLGNVQVRLLIANAGSNSQYATLLVRQIEQVMHNDKTIVGVMGWPFSNQQVIDAVKELGKAGIPMVSPSASSDALSGISPYWFRVVPTNTSQAQIGAQYAKLSLSARTVAIFSDPTNSYSCTLAADFKDDFAQGSYKVIDEEHYSVNDLASVTAALARMQNKNIVPDFIYLSGYSRDLSALLASLPSSEPYAHLQVLGGDGFYGLGGIFPEARSNLNRVHFTAFAYPDEWGILCGSGQRLACRSSTCSSGANCCSGPLFFSEYAMAFNNPVRPYPCNGMGGSRYGYTRPDSGAMLSYDAMLAILTASYHLIMEGNQHFKPGDLQRALTRINESNAIQGVSGRISFGTDGNPTDKAIVMLYILKQDNNAFFREESISLLPQQFTDFFASCYIQRNCL